MLLNGYLFLNIGVSVMAKENELERLEEFVATLLSKFNDMQGKNREMGERLQRRDATIENLEDELASMKDERGDISTRVSSLIGKIEEWESASGDSEEEDAAADPSEDKGADSGVQGNLFSAEAQNA